MESNYNIFYILLSHVMLLLYSGVIVYMYADQRLNKDKYKVVPINRRVSIELFSTAVSGFVLAFIFTIAFVYLSVKNKKAERITQAGIASRAKEGEFELLSAEQVSVEAAKSFSSSGEFYDKNIKNFMLASHFVNFYTLALCCLYLAQKGKQVSDDIKEPGSEMTKYTFIVSIVIIFIILVVGLFLIKNKVSEMVNSKSKRNVNVYE